MKKGRRLLAVLLVTALVVTISFIIWPRNPEPEYQGKTLSEWIAPPHSLSNHWKAQEAIRQMGAKSVPWLLKWIREPTPMQLRIERAVWKLPPNISNHRLMRWSHYDYPKRFRADLAVNAFPLVGDAGKSAIPELTRLACHTNRYAFYALVALDPDGIAILPALLERRDFPFRAEALRSFGLSLAVVTNRPIALPVAARCLSDPKPKVATTAALLLLEWRIEPATAVPLLTGALRHPRAEVRQTCADALASFGADARSAVPALEVCLKDSDLSVRQAAANALYLIAPDTVDRK